MAGLGAQRDRWLRHGAGHDALFGYDSMNRLTSMTDALGNVATSVYDPAGRANALNFPQLSTAAQDFFEKCRVK